MNHWIDVRRRAQRLALCAWILAALATGPVALGEESVSPFISEFVALNESGEPDEDGDRSDWIEIQNPASSAADMNGWFLTDDASDLRKWEFPKVSIPAGGFLCVFASGKDRADADSELHTNFKLSGSGEYLALVRPDGVTTASEFAPAYPAQLPNVAYGVRMEAVSLVGPGAEARALVPTDGTLGGAWRDADFLPGEDWLSTHTGVGFNIADLSAAGELLIDLDAERLASGTLETWRNPGTLGDFTSGDFQPVVQEIDGVRAVTFNGQGDWLRSRYDVFESVTGQENWSIEVWAHNPEIALKETMLSWALLKGTGGKAASLNYGSASAAGAVEHWGSSDMSYAGGPPTSGTWSHIVLTYSGGADGRECLYVDGVLNTSQTASLKIHGPGDEMAMPCILGASASSLDLTRFENFFSGSLARVRMHSGELSAGQVRNHFLADAEYFGKTPPEGFKAHSDLIAADLESLMLGKSATAYLRIEFQVDEPGAFDALALAMRYDDGFAAWLNGVPIASRNAPAQPAWDSTATGAQTGRAPLQAEPIDVVAGPSLLRSGRNVLAVQGLNAAADDADFRLLPELVGMSRESGQTWYLAQPTPGAMNQGVALVGDVRFSHTRGFYDEPFDLTLSTATDGADIFYTLDGSEPTPTNGKLYTEAIRTTRTTLVRALARKSGWLDSLIATQTILFAADVIRQPNNPDGFPKMWDYATADYEMDPEIVDDPAYRDTIIEDIKSIPTLSIVMDPEDLFGARKGIYTFPEQRGSAWERPASVEMLLPGGESAFQVGCGVRIWGFGWRAHSNSMKHAFRLKFKGQYGPKKLEYPFFSDAPVERFDNIVLRSQGSSGWNDFRPESIVHTQYIHDAWCRDTQRDMGAVDGHATFVHLYLNGLYWGLYNPVERPDAGFGEEYFGGSEEDYDAINRRDTTHAINGNMDAWRAMQRIAEGELAEPERYEALQNYLNIDDFCDYALLNIYATNHDGFGGSSGLQNNMRALRKREPVWGFLAFVWDMEFTFWEPDEGINVLDVPDTFSYVYNRAILNEEFRMRYADHAHRHFFNGGALTPEAADARWQARADEIYGAVVCESARWGDRRREPPYTRDVEWAAELGRLKTIYFPNRARIMIEKMREAGLYPEVDAPILYVNGAHQHGGEAPLGAAFAMSNEPDLRERLVESGNDWRYIHDGSDQGEAWRSADFDDSSWPEGPSMLSTSPADAVTLLTPSLTETPYVTTYFRHTFQVEEKTNLRYAQVRLARDDGAVVYLNGREVLRDNMPEGEIAFGTEAQNAVSGISQGEYHDFLIDVEDIQLGENILAVEVHQTAGSSDVRFDLELIVGLPGVGHVNGTIYYTTDGTDPRLAGGAVNADSVREYAGPFPLDANADWRSGTIKARALLDGKWSALTEADFSLGPVAQSLRVTEIMYHPPNGGALDSDEYEFLELRNVGSEPIGLDGVRLSGAVDFDFVDGSIRTLAPGAFVLVVGNRPAFEERYGPALPIAGEYLGKLANGGETVELSCALAGRLQRTAYDDRNGWPKEPDGEGPALEYAGPLQASASAYADKRNWRASAMSGGSPGLANEPEAPLQATWVLY